MADAAGARAAVFDATRLVATPPPSTGALAALVSSAALIPYTQPQQSAVQAAAVPAPSGSVVGGTAPGNNLVLVASAVQAASVQ